MPHLFGYDRLAQQIGDLVAAKVHNRSKGDYLSRPGEVGTTAIEKLFVYALEAFCEYDSSVEREWVLVYRQLGEFERDAGKEPFAGVCVEQQLELGGWRADFLVHRYDWICEKWRHVIVECDGHEFHERTKEQAARDRSRDRRASLSGVTVLRFTGSEIWRNPLGCAEQVMHWFVAESAREKPVQAA